MARLRRKGLLYVLQMNDGCIQKGRKKAHAWDLLAWLDGRKEKKIKRGGRGGKDEGKEEACACVYA